MPAPRNYAKYPGLPRNVEMRAAGWDKIKDVSVLRTTDETGRTTDEHIQILSDDGDWFLLDGIRHDDPSADELAEQYRKRGWTDSRCIYMGKANAAQGVVATGLAYDAETRGWTTPVRYEARDRMEAVRWMNFNRDWMKSLKIEGE